MYNVSYDIIFISTHFTEIVYTYIYNYDTLCFMLLVSSSNFLRDFTCIQCVLCMYVMYVNYISLYYIYFNHNFVNIILTLCFMLLVLSSNLLRDFTSIQCIPCMYVYTVYVYYNYNTFISSKNYLYITLTLCFLLLV